MTEISDRLSAVLADRYRIERPLGQGGMAYVFLATDRKHARRVAVKVLREELGAAVGAERFLREIRVTANLQHPHIVPLYESGEADGLVFFVMPYIEGESLRDRLVREGRMAVADVLRILRDVVDALAYAHARGVVHRDIKPDNVMLSGRHAVVADFGVAKAVTEASGRHEVTTAGVTLGTPAYMAPEQVAADPRLDHRVDLYAVGALAYEMLTGRPPFQEASPQAVLAAHLTQAPEAVTSRRADTPSGLADVVQRCLEKDPSDRWQTAEQLLVAIDGIPGRASGKPRWLVSGRVRQLLLGVGVVGLLATGLMIGFRRGDTASLDERPSVAVLPFDNIGGDPEDEYFSDGITEDVIARLARVAGLKVISRTSVMRYKDHQQTLREIGDALDATAVVEGSVRQAGSRVRVVAQLIDVRTDNHLWAQTYDRDVDDIFAIQTEVAEQIVAALGTALGTGTGSARRLTDNVDAYRLYLRGRFLWGRRQEATIRQAIEYFEQAIALDSGFALAWAALGDAHVVLPDYSNVSEAEAAAAARPALLRALALDPSLGQPHATLGNILVGEHQWEESDAEFRRALELSPGYATAHQWLALSLVARGRIDEAIAELERALELDPLSAKFHENMGFAMYAARRFEESLDWYRRLVELDPEHPGAFEGVLFNLTALDDAPRFIAWLERLDLAEGELYRAAREGDMAAANRVVADGGGPPVPKEFGLRALASAAIGEIDRALDLLERGFADGDWLVRFMKSAPYVDPLRQEPRFLAILDEMKVR